MDQPPSSPPPPAPSGSAPPSPTSSENVDAWKIFVGQIPRNMKEEDLFQYFATYGEIQEVFVLREQASSASKGCCFVRYKTRLAAEKCIEALNDKVTLPGATNPLQVSFANQAGQRNGIAAPTAVQVPQNHDSETKLFVGQLAQSTREPDLAALFEPYGVVREVHIIRNPQTGIFKGAGFVKFEDANGAKLAIAALNGKMLEGAAAPLKVDYAQQKHQNHQGGGGGGGMMGGNMMGMHRGFAMSPRSGGGGNGDGNPMNPNNGQVSPRYAMQGQMMAFQSAGPQGGGWYHAGAPAQMERKGTQVLPKLFVGGLTAHTTEEQLGHIFGYYGAVFDPVVLRYPNGQSKLSGFVKYQTEEEADVAVASLSNRYSLPGSSRPLTVRYAGTANTPPEHKLFVGHLPPNYEETQTTQLFAQFGEVVEVYVMRDARNASKGSAFVKFAQRGQAENAIQALHGSTSLSERPLKVSFALSRSNAVQQQQYPSAQLPPPPLAHNLHHHHLAGQAQQAGGVQAQGLALRGAENANGMLNANNIVNGQEHMQMHHVAAQAGYGYGYPAGGMPQYFQLAAGGEGSTQAHLPF